MNNIQGMGIKGYMRLFSKRREREPVRLKRVLIVAGPPSSGKSSFLNDPNQYLSGASIPRGLRSDLLSGARMGLPALVRHTGQVDACVCLHVDLMQPFHGRGLHTSEALKTSFTSKAYQEWGVLECLRDAEEVVVVTLCLSRKELFRRWFERSIARGEKRMPARMVALYGDDREDAATLRALYSAWTDYVSSLPVRQHCGLDVSQGNYVYHPGFDPRLVVDG